MTNQQLQTVLDALENGIKVRNCEGGTKYQPPLEAAAISIIKQMMEAEPVLYQRRMKPDYGPDWTHWDDCSEATFKDCLRVPKLHGWTHEARALYAAPKAPPVWLPISSAPKDGTWVLAINAKTNPSRQHVVRYFENTGIYPWKTDTGHMDWVAGITHWLPLPSAPKREM
jgi:hypothetical protein